MQDVDVVFTLVGGFEFHLPASEGAPAKRCCRACAGNSLSRVWSSPLPGEAVEPEEASPEDIIEVKYLRYSSQALHKVGLLWVGLIVLLCSLFAQRCLAIGGYASSDSLQQRDPRFNHDATVALWLIENIVQLLALGCLLILHGYAVCHVCAQCGSCHLVAVHRLLPFWEAIRSWKYRHVLTVVAYFVCVTVATFPALGGALGWADHGCISCTTPSLRVRFC